MGKQEKDKNDTADLAHFYRKEIKDMVELAGLRELRMIYFHIRAMLGIKK